MDPLSAEYQERMGCVTPSSHQHISECEPGATGVGDESQEVEYSHQTTAQVYAGSGSEADERRRQKGPFWGLPREIRDMIWSAVIINSVGEDGNRRFVDALSGVHPQIGREMLGVVLSGCHHPDLDLLIISNKTPGLRLTLFISDARVHDYHLNPPLPSALPSDRISEMMALEMRVHCNALIALGSANLDKLAKHIRGICYYPNPFIDASHDDSRQKGLHSTWAEEQSWQVIDKILELVNGEAAIRPQ
ncbi:hypothetical protein PG996_004146 [Apiospora saccharicola]|uniref:Uncharacterized protein n=1 Tax=Apiospora saccharicola TaxID=335842 RepID=A0ABR1W619_9PEZI